MKIQDNHSVFSFRPPGVLKSSVSTSSHARFPLTPAFDGQDLTLLSQGIDPNHPDPSTLINQTEPEALFFFTLKDAYVLVKEGMDGVILTEDLHPIQESLYYDENGSFSKNMPDLKVTHTLDEAFLPFDPQWMHYHHWMGYCLSKSYLANLYIPPTIQIIVPEYRESYHSSKNAISYHLYQETLEKAGLQSRVTFLKDGVYKIKKLSFFQPNSHLPYSYFDFTDARKLFTFLNKHVKYRDNLPTRFMIAQEDTMEPVISDSQNNILLQTCQKMNIPVVYLKNMDWSTQIALFSQAEFIITPHRPELINLYFCQNETRVLELTAPYKRKNHLPAWPFLIASTNKIHYSFLDVSTGELNADFLTNVIHKISTY